LKFYIPAIHQLLAGLISEHINHTLATKANIHTFQNLLYSTCMRYSVYFNPKKHK